VSRLWLRLKPSLFWTFAGSFLLVLVTAALLQAWGVVMFVSKVEDQRVADRAVTVAREAARGIQEFLAQPPPGDGDTRARQRVERPGIGRVFHDLQPQDGSFWLLYQTAEGWVEEGWHLNPEEREALSALLGVDILGPPQGRFQGPFEGAARGGGAGNGGQRPPRPRGEDGRPRRPPLHGAVGGPPGSPERPPRNGPGRPPLPPDLSTDLRAGALRVVARQAVQLDSGEHGAVVALMGRSRGRGGNPMAPSAWLFSLPITLILAACAGLLLFRLFLNRLRALEVLAGRVEAGDLGARVRVVRKDEIGRLGMRLNRMTAALEEAHQELARADQQRRRLLADISHELATPLTSIRGYTETLLDPAVPTTAEEREGYLRDVLDEARRMNLLIQDLFELTRLEAEAGGLERESLDWTALCRNTMERFEPRFRQAGLGLRWQGAVEPSWLSADGRRLEQVLENLLANALRYVPRGGTVTLSLESLAVGYQLAVRDDGPGIPEADLPHVFDRFFRAASARGAPGSGLGLAIVKEIVERHGGTVRATTRQGSGTVFHVFLPATDAVQ
jgi:signal transduction histidine kinase